MTQSPKSNQSAWTAVRRRLRQRLLTMVDLNAITSPAANTQGLRSHETAQEKLRQTILEQLAKEQDDGLTGPARERLIQELTDELIGFGPIIHLMDDSTISEIMVNGPSTVFIERAGRIEQTNVAFRDEEHLLFCIERMLEPLGITVTEADPFADASLPDGSRLNIILAPLSLSGPILTIRKQLTSFSMQDLVSFGSITSEATEFLSYCVKAHVNIVISGGTSTGKTTLVTALSSYIAPQERVITIENMAELQLTHKDHWIRLVSRPANVEGRGEISLRQLVSNALRMRPDRIILGEARGSEALDVIQAMHTGHEGFITVLHANAPMAALERLETLMLMSEVELPLQACRRQVASVIELVIHLSRFPDGSRRIAKISQVVGVTDQGFIVEDLFAFVIKQMSAEGHIVGQLEPTGCQPVFLKKFETHNLTMPQLVATVKGGQQA